MLVSGVAVMKGFSSWSLNSEGRSWRGLRCVA